MQKIIKTLLKDNIRFIAISVTILITFLSLYRFEKQQINIHNIDKAQHLIAYFVLTLCWLLTLKKIKSIYVILGCVSFGILIEVLQKALTTYRSADFYDIIANTLGSVIALLFFTLFIKK